MKKCKKSGNLFFTGFRIFAEKVETFHFEQPDFS